MKTFVVLSVLVVASFAAQVPVSPAVSSRSEDPVVVQQAQQAVFTNEVPVAVALPVARPVSKVPEGPVFTKQADPAYNEVPYPPASYDFVWTVKDGLSYVDMGHSEARKGDLTTGEYFVLLPDGRRQIVKYRVDGYSGFVPQVSYVQVPATHGGASNVGNKY